MSLKNKSVFITGATGFIGGRVAERLWIDCGIASNCLIRNYSNAARIARLPVKMIPGDVLKRDSIETAMEGCEIVFHCAYGNTNDNDLNRRINEEGTRNVGEIALSNAVKRFIYISSVAVYGPSPPERVDEETPTQFTVDQYGNSKIRTEGICKELIRSGLPVVIIRPTVVYGPFSPIWTIGTIKRVFTGGWENVYGMNGLCNAVYIDDLVESLFLCLNTKNSIGETFIVSGDRPIKWNDYYASYLKMVDLPVPQKISKRRRKIKEQIRNVLRPAIGMIRKFFEPQLLDIYFQMKDNKPHLAMKIESFIRGGIRDNEVNRYSHKTLFSIDKAKQVLGYSPRSFEDGMKITHEWLKHHGYI